MSDADTLAPALRARIAQGWVDAALDEHASIAAFSRFALHLMAVGAPSELLEAAHRAGLDEIRHTRLCLDLAEGYAGQPVAPGPLDLPADLLGPLTLPAIVGAAVAEGCVGETIAAHEARHLAAVAAPPAVRKALAVIARDEQAHADLAWRFLAWALRQGDPAVRAAAAAAFGATADAPLGPPPPPDPPELATHGLAGPALRHKLREIAVQEVIWPLRQAVMRGAAPAWPTGAGAAPRGGGG